MPVPSTTRDENARGCGGEMSERPALPERAWGPGGRGRGGRVWGGRPPAIQERSTIDG
jgi:hypothetical protein